MSLVAVFHRDRGPRLDEYQWNVVDFVDPNPNIAFWQNSPKFARLRQSSFWDPVAMASLVSTFHDAAVSPEAWPEALKVLTDAAGVAGAALIISNKRTANVDQAYFSGLSAGFKSDYIRHYAALDPYSPLLDGSWIKLSECLPDSMLRKSEWYNDFVLTCGVRDILGARLVDTPYHCVIFGIHQQIGRDLSDRVDSLVDLVTIPLKQAAWRCIERLSSGSDAFDELNTEVLAGQNRFYFDIENGNRYPDKTGSVFSTPDDAVAHAFVIAQELAQDGSWHGSSIVVTDDRGQEITCVRIGR